MGVLNASVLGPFQCVPKFLVVQRKHSNNSCAQIDASSHARRSQRRAFATPPRSGRIWPQPLRAAGKYSPLVAPPIINLDTAALKLLTPPLIVHYHKITVKFIYYLILISYKSDLILIKYPLRKWNTPLSPLTPAEPNQYGPQMPRPKLSQFQDLQYPSRKNELQIAQTNSTTGYLPYLPS